MWQFVCVNRIISTYRPVARYLKSGPAQNALAIYIEAVELIFNHSYGIHIMSLVINSLRDTYVHMQAHTEFPDEGNYKKPGVFLHVASAHLM